MLSWQSISGHDSAKQVLQQAVRSGTLHHGLLFNGPKGVGKRELAISLSAAINCTTRQPGDWGEGACMTCVSCRKTGQGIHPDLHLIEAQGATIKTIKIEQIRALQKLTSKAPYEGRERVILILGAHLMSEEASNALLKTLEEPTTGTRLILTTDQAHKLLPTILSRCQMVRFGPLERPDVVTILKTLGEEEDWGVDEKLLYVASGFAEGSPGRALEALQNAILEERADLIGQIGGLRPNHPRDYLELAEALGKKNDRLLLQLDLLKTFFRDVMRFHIRHVTEELIHEDLSREVQQFCDTMTTSQVLGALDSLEEAQVAISRNANSQLVMERLLRDLRPTKRA